MVDPLLALDKLVGRSVERLFRSHHARRLDESAGSNAELARATRVRLWAEHLQRTQEEVSADAVRVVDELWKPIAEEQHERRQAGLPPTHRLCLLPGVSRRSRRLLGPLQGLLVDG